MALDFYRGEEGEHLFALSDNQVEYLSVILETFREWTGVMIDQYGDGKLSTENCGTLINIIDQYIAKTDLNANKQKTVAILEWRGLLQYFAERGIDMAWRGD